eukprot:XP_001695553.1 predicted protein [Chlamydomonas reinhardtii]
MRRKGLEARLLCLFAYMYARPFIRVGLGSAKRGFINFSTLYIVWLCSAVFYHLPSLASLGLDVRADVSFLIVVFLASLAFFRGLRELWVVLLLNAAIIAVACSTYYTFCGNGRFVVSPGRTPPLKAAVCSKWLHPILTSEYPRFSSWMLYGEGSGLGLDMGNATAAGGGSSRNGSSSSSSSSGSGSFISVDFPLDGEGVKDVPAGDVLSPVFSMWVTLVAVYVGE